MRKGIALIGMATAMMAAQSAIRQPHDFGDTLSYAGNSSKWRNKTKRDRMNPLKAERLAKTKRNAARKARKINRR